VRKRPQIWSFFRLTKWAPNAPPTKIKCLAPSLSVAYFGFYFFCFGVVLTPDDAFSIGHISRMSLNDDRTIDFIRGPFGSARGYETVKRSWGFRSSRRQPEVQIKCLYRSANAYYLVYNNMNSVFKAVLKYLVIHQMYINT